MTSRFRSVKTDVKQRAGLQIRIISTQKRCTSDTEQVTAVLLPLHRYVCLNKEMVVFVRMATGAAGI